MVKSEVYNSDCLASMREMPDAAYSLAPVDVPYGIGEDGGKNHSRSVMAVSRDYKPFAGNDLKHPPHEYFLELFRVSRNQIIFGANHFIEMIRRNSPCWIVWDKDNGLNDFADCEIAWTSFPTAVRRFKYKWHGMLQEDMANKEARIHPTQKPVALYRWLLTNYANSGDTILDTHMGSQSLRIAAYDLGFDFCGFEIDPDYFKAGCERFERHIAQPKLWTPTQVVETQEGLF